LTGSRVKRKHRGRYAEIACQLADLIAGQPLSPAMIAEYETQLPDKNLLQTKLHEFY
jgi:hypothetical protein